MRTNGGGNVCLFNTVKITKTFTPSLTPPPPPLPLTLPSYRYDRPQFFSPSESTLVQTCHAGHPFMCRLRHAPKFVHTLKIPYPSVVK